ncbi:hypothetical protein NEPAR06_0761 [Nematocida parisii]|uniref:Ras modification protein ERF4 n=1 Tax=Nematocida parisii (strain ERTm3) TaxID=935791 RepID=I3EJ65_NEMP3|nr:uncharacterized protein NEPG_02500 [Nematocida parisii ERTm1]EIJ89262.1 hypothetical protein NEQG_00032 [Nematocida parisii ERTm3]KAI5125631.1 hypothetical protein NEPAR03_0159 [Nematocida parisii]EIJ92612.1 hypothetical protein NEPG_02500 [Nematocida parisii ERTm1]KAI5125747.1 hypothetical protein NEPAR08_0185 [Nematocida parisii]KAI5140220.1 hypothetical protein NEPAR04_0165 [Nematocida parisii]|eukprot:XP_013060327.1 hypothetical protein NEPG_02500 [Nematocida parisii ERTm1]
MSIVYIPALTRNSLTTFEETLPSPLYARVSENEWKEITVCLNQYLFKRRDKLLFKVLAPVLIGNILRSITNAYVDKQVQKYLAKKNLILSHRGIHIHHPKDRQYSGIDVSIYSSASFPINIQ